MDPEPWRVRLNHCSPALVPLQGGSVPCSLARKRKLDVRPQIFKGTLAHIKGEVACSYYGDLLFTFERCDAFFRLVSLANGVAAGSCKNCCALLFSAVTFNAAMALLKDLIRLMDLIVTYIHSIKKQVVNNHVSSELLVCLSLMLSQVINR